MNRLLLPGIFILNFCLIGKSNYPDPAVINSPFHVAADTVDPVIFCPNSQIVNLAPMACDTVLTYTIQTFDDQGQVILILLDGIPSGSPFPSGATVNTWLATDLAGNTATCSFTITTLEPMTQPNCRELTYVLLDNNCADTLSAFDVLQGGPYGCSYHYFIEVDKTLPFGNGPWVDAEFDIADVGEDYQIRVTALLSNARCWGNIRVRDSLPPSISVLPIHVPCILPLEQLTPAFLRDSFGIPIAMPVVSDACTDSVSITFVDVQQNLPCDDTTTVSGVIHRLWTATDVFGNATTVEQTVYRHRLLSEVQIPGNKTTDCDSPDLSEDTNGTPFMVFGGRKYVLTPESYCEFDVQSYDTIQPSSCGGNYLVQRTWKIYDACLPFSATNPKIAVQTIAVVDNSGPVISCPGAMLVNVVDINCRASVNLPDIFMSDNCSAINSLQAFWTDSSLSKTLVGSVEYMAGDTLGIFGTVASFPVGTTTMLYVAEDACGNTSDCSFALTVANTVPPTAKCDSLLLVGLPSNGYLNMPALVLDNGSTDDCSPVAFKAKLLEANACQTGLMFSDTVHICCHNSGDTLVGTLRVYDISVPVGEVAGSFGTGHFTDCTFKIRVSGTNPPGCTAPANITVNCAAFDPTLEAYGGLLSQTCSVDSVSLTVNWSNFDTLCARGTINRLFKVFSANGQMAQCTQQIKVDYAQDYFIRFPDDVILTTCDSSSMYGAPQFFGEDCEDLEVTFNDEQFNVVPDACYKIERTWTILNRCTFNPDMGFTTVPNPGPNPVTNHVDNLVGPVVSSLQTPGDPWQSTLIKINPTDAQPTNYSIFFNPNANGYKYKQLIKILDSKAPVMENCTNQTFNVDDQTNNDPMLWNAQYWFDPLHVSTDLCEAPSPISVTATDACSGGDLEISFQLLLDLNGDGLRESVLNSNSLPPSNTIYYNNVVGPGETRQFDFRSVSADNKWRFALQLEEVGNKKVATISFNTTANPNTYFPLQLPHGSHKVRWFATDKCGNQIGCEREVKVQDKKAPTVFCKTGLSVNIQPTQTIQLYATDFLQFADDNCTPSQYLIYSIRKAGTGTGFPVSNGLGDPVNSIIYGCDELSLNAIELWSRDRSGNVGFCTTNLLVQDGSFNCLGIPLEVSGQIETETGEGVDEVMVGLGTAPDPQLPFLFTEFTDPNGEYTFDDGSIFQNNEFSITPILDENDQNGLTTFDLVLISKHILAIEALGSPYKLIAADANKSNSITTSDIVELRKLILGINPALPNNTSWRFVPADFVFMDTSNPFAQPFPEKIVVQNIFSSISDADFIGVKIGDVNNSVVPNANALADDRNMGTTTLAVSVNGRETFAAGEVFDVAFAATEELLGAQFTLNFEGLEVLEIVPGAHIGQENFGFFPERGAVTFSCDKSGFVRFVLKCRARESGNLREMFQLNSRITKAEAYRNTALQAAQRMDLRLQFPESQVFELFQNRPNPFVGTTHIAFNLPEASEATLKIFDADGRLLFTKSGEYERGVQHVTIEKSELDAVGVLYYQLETPKHSAMRKMVRI